MDKIPIFSPCFFIFFHLYISPSDFVKPMIYRSVVCVCVCVVYMWYVVCVHHYHQLVVRFLILLLTSPTLTLSGRLRIPQNLGYSHQYAKFYKITSRIAIEVLKRDISIEIKGLSNGTARIYIMSIQRV
jgi:hypothetical protein